MVDRKYHTFYNLLLKYTPGELTVDHINRNALDNRRENLRLATQKEQIANRGLLRTNTSGHTGVARTKNNGHEYWEAVWWENGRRRTMAFSIKKYGEEGAKQLATAFLPYYYVVQARFSLWLPNKQRR